MILIIDLTTQSWSSFTTSSLKPDRHSDTLARFPQIGIDRAAIIVSNLGSETISLATGAPNEHYSEAESRQIPEIVKKFPKVPIWLVSDSAFFRSLPASAFSLMITGDSVRRYGRQGLIHGDLAAQAAQALGKSPLELNIISLFLDENSSVAAIKEGIAIEVSSGISALEGLPGAYSSGSIDGEYILQLAKAKGVGGARKILTEQSGLLGRSGFKGSLRDILAKPKLRTNAKFHLSLRIYLHRLTLLMGGYQALLGRTDVVVFSGILGTKSAFIREELAASLGLLRYSNILTLQARPHLLAAQMIRSL